MAAGADRVFISRTRNLTSRLGSKNIALQFIRNRVKRAETSSLIKTRHLTCLESKNFSQNHQSLKFFFFEFVFAECNVLFSYLTANILKQFRVFFLVVY